MPVSGISSAAFDVVTVVPAVYQLRFAFPSAVFQDLKGGSKGRVVLTLHNKTVITLGDSPFHKYDVANENNYHIGGLADAHVLLFINRSSVRNKSNTFRLNKKDLRAVY